MLSVRERGQVSIIILLLSAYAILTKCKRSIVRAPTINRDDERRMALRRMYKESDAYCHEQLHMRRDVFYRLCNRLKLHGLVKRRSVKVKEQVAIFLLIVGQDARYRLGKFTFIRSSQTVSRYFHFVLRAIISMYKEVVKPARATNSPWDGDGDEDWYHYFKDAVGAIDGTHINATVPVNQQSRYRNRKAQITQNVLVACTFDMMFTYALVGWEGSAHDGRLLRDAVRPRVDRLTVPLGKFYLADAGFPHVPGFMTPFRGVKYHMSEYKKGRDPRNALELYNYRHSSLRTIVERTIGLLKKRFAYLRKSPFFDIKTQSRIILACVALHNYLRENDPDDICDSEYDSSEEDDSLEEDEEEDEEPGEEEHIVIARSVEWTEKREAFAHTMWNEQD